MILKHLRPNSPKLSYLKWAKGHFSPMVYKGIKYTLFPSLHMDKGGNTPILLAAQQGRVDILEYLFSTGLKVKNHQNKQSETAIYLASKKGYLEAVELLVKHGADISLRDSKGISPKEIAHDKDYKDIEQYLVFVEWVQKHFPDCSSLLSCKDFCVKNANKQRWYQKTRQGDKEEVCLKKM